MTNYHVVELVVEPKRGTRGACTGMRSSMYSSVGDPASENCAAIPLRVPALVLFFLLNIKVPGVPEVDNKAYK